MEKNVHRMRMRVLAMIESKYQKNSLIWIDIYLYISRYVRILTDRTENKQTTEEKETRCVIAVTKYFKTSSGETLPIVFLADVVEPGKGIQFWVKNHISLDQEINSQDKIRFYIIKKRVCMIYFLDEIKKASNIPHVE